MDLRKFYGYGLGKSEAYPATSCKQIHDISLKGGKLDNGVYWIKTSADRSVQTYCDLTNGGWTLVGKVSGFVDKLYTFWLIKNYSVDALSSPALPRYIKKSIPTLTCLLIPAFSLFAYLHINTRLLIATFIYTRKNAQVDAILMKTGLTHLSSAEPYECLVKLRNMSSTIPALSLQSYIIDSAEESGIEQCFAAHIVHSCQQY